MELMRVQVLQAQYESQTPDPHHPQAPVVRIQHVRVQDLHPNSVCLSNDNGPRLLRGEIYMSSSQGRFTSADPYEINVEVSTAKSEDQRQSLLNGYIGNPQVWNGYAYTLNIHFVWWT